MYVGSLRAGYPERRGGGGRGGGVSRSRKSTLAEPGTDSTRGDGAVHVLIPLVIED